MNDGSEWEGECIPKFGRVGPAVPFSEMWVTSNPRAGRFGPNKWARVEGLGLKEGLTKLEKSGMGKYRNPVFF